MCNQTGKRRQQQQINIIWKKKQRQPIWLKRVHGIWFSCFHRHVDISIHTLYVINCTTSHILQHCSIRSDLMIGHAPTQTHMWDILNCTTLKSIISVDQILMNNQFHWQILGPRMMIPFHSVFCHCCCFETVIVSIPFCTVLARCSSRLWSVHSSSQFPCYFNCGLMTENEIISE